MAIPQFVPTDPVDRPRSYDSPEHVPGSWQARRPAEVQGRQPSGGQLGYQGPDQGYALLLSERFNEQLWPLAGETLDDVVRGCLGVALRRASIFGRAPVIHDFTVAYTAWGFFDPGPPEALVAIRGAMFAGVANVIHHYAEARAIADQAPEATLRMTPKQVGEAFPGRWRELLGF
jgi:hypothetical protein